jgi:hypothetical protein
MPTNNYSTTTVVHSVLPTSVRLGRLGGLSPVQWRQELNGAYSLPGVSGDPGTGLTREAPFREALAAPDGDSDTAGAGHSGCAPTPLAVPPGPRPPPNSVDTSDLPLPVPLAPTGDDGGVAATEPTSAAGALALTITFVA